MKNRRLFAYKLFLYMLLFVTMFAMVVGFKFWVVDSVPDKILVRKGKEERLVFDIPVSAAVAMSDGVEITSPVSKEVRIVPGMQESYQMQVKYMGLIPLKEVDLDVVSGMEVSAVGVPVGIYVKTQGVLVIDTGDYVNQKGEDVAPSAEVLQKGDNILDVNGIKISGKRQFVNLIEKSDGNDLVLTVLRNGVISKVKVTPQQNEEGIYKMGVWVRDSAQGIGTLSFITKDGQFAALGHGVTDADTGALMEIAKGSIYETCILSIQKGNNDGPGELSGVMTYDETDYLGAIYHNTEEGIYGKLSEEFLISEYGQTFLQDCLSYPVGLKQEIKCGPAKIYMVLHDTPAFYDIEIEEVSLNPAIQNRGIMLTVTDPELLLETGGIVQGMSGSPIIQDGKIIGAVTHVLVNDPTRGYGIFLESMLNHGN